jgi:hypothetical protein
LLISVVVHGHREGYRIWGCRNNLKTIGLALDSYHERYGQFPPPYIADADGWPMHSWRVLILPYLSDTAALNVYQQYRLNEPWNSPHNQKLATQIPREFRCPTTNAIESDSPLDTHYVAVTGPGTAWPERAGMRREDMVDGCGNTVLLVEIADSNIQWLEPRDVAIEEVFAKDNEVASVPKSHHHLERTYFFYRNDPLAGNVLMADGAGECLQKPLRRDQLASLLSIAGGEPIDRDAIFQWRRGTTFSRLDLRRCAGFALFLVFFILLVWQRPAKASEPSAKPIES